MPLTSIPSEAALANLRRNRASAWPDGRRDRVRLSGVAQVGFEPSFTLEPGEKVFTVGSCFARNIEGRLQEVGFEVPARALALPADERASDTENDFLNKYTPHSILNEIRWALDPAATFPKDGYIAVRGSTWHDPHSAPNLKPASLERVAERRRMVSELYAQIPQCRVLVMTLGLVEAWFDEQTGYYLNGKPPAASLQAEPERFRLDVLTPDEVLGALREIHDLLVRFGHPDFRMLLTVSPVPFRNTFTGRDAIAANSYSKSALRAAAEMFVAAHNQVDYFPSYEIVTQTERASAFIQDNRHVTPQLVNTIVDRVVQAYCPSEASSGEFERISARKAAMKIQQAIKSGDFEGAARVYGQLEARDRYLRAGYDEFSFRYDYGRILMRVGAMADARVQLARAAAAKPSSAPAHFQLGRALARLQRPLEAEESFREAVALSPESIDMRLAWANQLADLSHFDEAEGQLRAVLDFEPGEPRAEAALNNLNSHRAAKAAAGAGA